MKGKNTIWIIVGVILLLVIIFFVYRANRQKKLAAQAERDRLNQLTYGPGGTETPAIGVQGTLDSVSDVIDSLSNLFGGGDGNGQNGANQGVSDATYRQFENECELIYNTSADVELCIKAKIAGVT